MSDFKLLIWEIKGKTATQIVNIDLPCACSKVEFDPSNPDYVSCLASGGKKVLVYKTVKILDRYETDLATYTLPESASISSLSWGFSGHLAVGSVNGSLCFFSSRTKEKLKTLAAGSASPVVSVVLSLAHFIVCHGDTSTFWYAKNEDSLPSSTILQRASLEDEGAISLQNNLDYSRLLLITENNCMFEVQMDVDEPAAEEPAEGEAEPVSMIQFEDTTKEFEPEIVDFDQVTSFHSRPVTSIASLVLAGKAPVPTILTAGTDGIVKIWKVRRNDSRRTSPVSPSSFLTPLT